MTDEPVTVHDLEVEAARLRKRAEIFEEELAAAAAMAAARFGAIGRWRKVLGAARAALRGRLLRRLREDRDIRLIARSGLFDAGAYLRRYPDVASRGADPIVHYVRCGAAEGRDPGPFFDTRFYLDSNPDVAAAGINPFAHYALHGAREGRRPNWRSEDGPKSHPSLVDPADSRFPWLTAAQRMRLNELLWRYGLAEEGDEWAESPAGAIKRIRATYAALPVSSSPVLSIVVPVHNQLRYTLACLESLAVWPSRLSFEVLVGDDASTDGTADCLADIPNVRVARGESNVGFLENCNRTAGLARGRLLVLLNNDTIVMPGWLDALGETLDADGEAGLVGSRLLYPDGSLQEAGGIVWRDASGWNYGRHGDPADPAYNFLRDADYCSGAAIALPRALWNQLGGFDPAYRPAYYEDTDLAFRVRAAGRRVLYQPEASVIHCEGKSHGTSEISGGKRHQQENRPKFLARWKETLADHGSAEQRPWNFAERSRIGRILVVDTTTPTPDRDSGSADTVNLMKILRRQGYHVTFLPENLVEIPLYTAGLRKIGVECLHLPHVSDLLETCKARAARADAVIVCRQPLAERVLGPIKAAAPQVPVIFNTIDLHFLRSAREARLFGDRAMDVRVEDMRRSELRSVSQADATTVVSRHEIEVLKELAPGARVHRVPIIRELPRGPFPGWGERTAVTFIGGFRHPPNQDAVRWLLQDIWPRARAMGLDAPLHIVGPDGPDFLKDDPENRVRVLGHVPDLGSVFAASRVSIAPIRYGAGLKGKVIDSLMHRVPAVVTSAAAEGSGLEHDRHVLIADQADALAACLVSLYRSQEDWTRLSAAGRDFCAANFSLDAADKAIKSLMTELGLPVRPGGDAA